MLIAGLIARSGLTYLGRAVAEQLFMSSHDSGPGGLDLRDIKVEVAAQTID